MRRSVIPYGVFLAILASILLVFASASHAEPPRHAAMITITGKVAESDCVNHRCGFVRLIEGMPHAGRHRSAITQIRPDTHFVIRAAAADLPPGRYDIETGPSRRNLHPTGETREVDGSNTDFGLICFDGSCNDL